MKDIGIGSYVGHVLSVLILLAIISCQKEDGFELPDGWELSPLDKPGRLFDVQKVSDQVVFISGSAGTIMKSINGGIDWDTIQTGFEADFTTLYFVSEQSGFVGARRTIGKEEKDDQYRSKDDAVLLETSDGGINWKQRKVRGISRIVDIEFSDSQTGYLIGGNIESLSCCFDIVERRVLNRRIYRTTDRGRNWNRVYADDEGPLNRITITENNCGFAIGRWSPSPKSLEFEMLKSNRNGKNWKIKEIPIETSGSVVVGDLAFTNGQIGLLTLAAEDYYGSVVLTLDGGESWSKVVVDGTKTLLFLDWYDSLRAVVSDTDGNIYRTTDQGRSWTQVRSSASGRVSIRAIEATSTGYIAVGDKWSIIQG